MPLVVVSAALMLFTNLSYPLVDNDEARYAEIPREMLVTGDWTSPQLNFEPYYDKPPLLYWLCATSYQVFGISEWSARIVPATSGFVLILSTMWFGSRMFGRRVGVLSAVVLLASAGFMTCGRFLFIDGLLSALVSLSFFAAYEAVRSGNLRWRWWILSAACCGLGVLAKGPVAGVLLGPPLFAFAFLTETSARLRIRHWTAFGGIVVGVAGTWFLAAAMEDSHLLYEFFYKHNVTRFAGAYHAKPFWFFVPIALAGGHPWTILMVPYGRFLFRRTHEARMMRPTAVGFLLLWVGWCLLFFSVSKCKLPAYILPAAPAFALLVAHYLGHVVFTASEEICASWAKSFAPWLAVVTTCIAALTLVTVSYVMNLGSAVSLVAAALLWIGVLGFVIAVRRKSKDHRLAWGVCSATALLLAVHVAHFLVPEIGREKTLFKPATEVAQLLSDADQPVATVAQEWSEVAFYTRRNDIRNFKGTGSKALSRFVARHPSTVIVERGRRELSRLRNSLPEGTRLTVIEESAKVRIILAERGPGVRTASTAVQPR